MTAAALLTPVTSLQDWFRHSVHAALDHQQVAVEVHTEHYLVQMLTAFARAENLFEHHRDGFGLKPLALMLADAVEAARPDERQLLLRRLGDVSLFIAGWFAGSLARRPVDVDYYARMGGAAYATLAEQPAQSTRAQALNPVYAELAQNFTACVDVLAEVAEGTPAARESDLLRLHELWLRTGSPRVARRLRELGCEPPPRGLARDDH